MQEEQLPGSVRSDLLERLKEMDLSPDSSSLAELAYRRAREALEKALEEARVVRLQAIADARATREREMTALLESMRALRQSAETQIEQLLREAEIEAERSRSQAAIDAREIVEHANAEAAAVRAEAEKMRTDAEGRRAEIERLEADFNATVEAMALRLGVTEKPSRGWWAKLTGGGK
jgi:hypothetical protein